MASKRPQHGGKAPIKRRLYNEEEEEDDPLAIANEKIKEQTLVLQKQQRKQLKLAVYKFNKHFKANLVSQDYFDKIVKMIRALRNHMDGAATTVMYAEDLLAFRRNALSEEVSPNLFTYDMQRKKDAHTVSVYGELVFKNDLGEGPFEYMVSENDLCIEMYVDGEEWENPEAFYTLLRFIVGSSSDEHFSRAQLVLMQNLFLEVLSHYFRELVKHLNQKMYPRDSFPTPEFIVRCIEDAKQW